MRRRFLSILLILCMAFTLFPSAVFAEKEAAIGTSSAMEGKTLCENHKEHDTDCGYIAAKDEKPCSHLNEDGSYSCAPVLDSGVSSNIASPGNAEEKYVCDHSDDCGYAEAVEGADCTHECELCKDIIADACVCEALCTESLINADCAACNAKGADLATVCKGEAPALLAAMPRAAGDLSTDDYTFIAATGTLTIKTNAGTTNWGIGSGVTDPDLIKIVVIESGVTEIGANAFNVMTNLASVTITNGVKTIGDRAFYNCTKLTTVTIPASVTSIGGSAFSVCTTLTDVTFEGATPPTIRNDPNDTFANNHPITAHVPAGKTDAYKTALKQSNTTGGGLHLC